MFASRRVQGEKGMSDLFDVDSSTKTSLLTIVALELNAMFLVGDAIGSDRRMMADLFRNQDCATELVIPMT